jgi:hypothetical protein
MRGSTKIYGLVDPREPGKVMYVGKSSEPEERLRAHIIAAQHGLTRKDFWIRKLQAEGIEPAFQILESVSFSMNWTDREKHWIKLWRSRNTALLNIACGGNARPDKTSVIRWTPEGYIYE